MAVITTAALSFLFFSERGIKMNHSEFLMTVCEKALEHRCDISIQSDHENKFLYIYIQPHAETLTIDNFDDKFSKEPED